MSQTLQEQTLKQQTQTQSTNPMITQPKLGKENTQEFFHNHASTKEIPLNTNIEFQREDRKYPFDTERDHNNSSNPQC